MIMQKLEELALAINSKQAPKPALAPAPKPLEEKQDIPIPKGSKIQNSYNKSAIKEFNKRVYSFLEAARLKGLENFNQWKQALAI